MLAEVPVQPTYAEFERLQEEQLEDAVWPLISDPATQKTVRHGAADLSIIEEAASWNADLLVVGSHGKGWVDRMLLGSTTERLINHLPVPLLVVPAGKALRRRPDRPAAVGALSATEDIP